MGIVEQYLLQLKTEKRRLRRTAVVLTALSLIVATGVSWNLRMTGVTLANDACCGYEEHQHTDECLVQNIVCDYDVGPAAEIDEDMAFAPYEFDPILDSDSEGEPLHLHVDECYQTEYRCGYEEHLHSLACYSNPTADVETPLDWQEMFEDYPYTGNLCEDLIGVAKTQVGYTESTLNFEADNDEVKYGYTRYGAWYGAPYNEWSAMFVSFCLHYAGADLSEYPINSGANTMAGLWDAQGRYTQAGAYFPTAGDLVFFEDNTVAIVAEVQTATIYVISGDVDDSVSGRLLPLNDASIIGWGMTGGSLSEEELIREDSVGVDFGGEDVKDDLPDISDGFVLNSNDAQSPMLYLENTQATTDLLAYLSANGRSYFFALLDADNKPLPKDEQGNYIAVANQRYKLTFGANSPDGFLPGTYQYQLPDGMTINGDSGDFVLDDGTNIGSWEVTDTGLITFVFNDEAKWHSEVTISSTFDIRFSEQDEPIVFDAKTIVTIQKPPESEEYTKLNKWGSQGSEEKEQDPTKIYWTLEITGQKDSQIPGSIITDRLMQGEQSYTQSDMTGGLHIGVGEYDLTTGNQIAWHAWDVTLNDPNLNWTEEGWTYEMPESIVCKWCPNPITLGNEGWIYYVEYTSTPTPLNIAGTSYYTNSVTLEDQQVTGWGEFVQGEAEVGVVKSGVFHGDANGGKFLWEFQVTVPGREEGERAAYYTQIMDHMRVKDTGNATIAYVTNDADKAIVTAVYNGQTITVPRAEDATDADPFAWAVGWSSDNGGIYYTRALLPLCRCNCTAESCHYWDAVNNCCAAPHYADSGWGAYRSDFCYCWTQEQNVTFTFAYETNDPAIIEAYGNMGVNLQNEAVLQQTVYQPDGTERTVTLGDATANVPIPGVFKKKLTKEFDGYIAHYQITINEARLMLTDGSPLTINDVMTDTLAYISGSLVITAEDAGGNTTVLQQGVDYTVTYDGTGNQTDQSGKKVHVLDIVILKPQPVMYTLDYDTTLIIPQHVTGGVTYSNAASITLWGKKITADTDEKGYTDINIAAKSYTVEMVKTCAKTKNPLSGATFGLYNAQGGLVGSGVTDATGKLKFQTNIIEGIILREHQLYYLQEIQPPPGYQLDDTKYWFCFCNEKDDTCTECNKLMMDTEAVRIPFETIGIFNIANYPFNVELPATGGIGIILHVLCGMLLVSAPLVYGLGLRRKYERRSRE